MFLCPEVMDAVFNTRRQAPLNDLTCNSTSATDDLKILA
jgi:hypothetical protein